TIRFFLAGDRFSPQKSRPLTGPRERAFSRRIPNRNHHIILLYNYNYYNETYFTPPCRVLMDACRAPRGFRARPCRVQDSCVAWRTRNVGELSGRRGPAAMKAERSSEERRR